MDLFDSAGTDDAGLPLDARAPLAVRMRPRSLDEVLGQDHLLAPGAPLRRLVEPADEARGRGAGVSSIILWGPPGTGKTTLAHLVARASGRRFVELSAVTAGVGQVREVIGDARRHLVGGEETVLFIDEVHRFSRTQQDALLPGVENRWVVLVAATTENPSFSVVSPLLSRSLLLTLRPLGADDVGALIDRALADERGLAGAVGIDGAARERIVRLAGSDARKSLTVLEAAAGMVLAAPGRAAEEPAGSAAEGGSSGRAAEEGPADESAGEWAGAPLITPADVERAADAAAVRYDRAGDQHYDVVSAFIKSMRGSDPDATLHYLARMIAAGEDPRYIARRIAVHAAEDVGLADPAVLATAVAAQQAVALIGMPEARLVLAEAALAVATAPKSNRSYTAIDAALADVRAGKAGPVPEALRDSHYASAADLGHGAGYRYAHDYEAGVAPMEFMPEGLEGARYYEPTTRGFESQITQRLARIREILDGDT